MPEATAPRLALAANRRNNEMHQELRLERWTSARDALWQVIDPLLADGARVALVGAGSCDDVPLVRILGRAALVDLVDFDLGSMQRALARAPAHGCERLRAVEHDVTGGSADLVLAALRDGTSLPEALPLPHGALGDGSYDLVVGDVLYTQLLHAGLISLGVVGERQHEVMRRYDPHLVTALVSRIQASLAPGGHAVHVHDVACWSESHTQPIELEEALADPVRNWSRLQRHDACDPHLVLARMGVEVVRSAWWEWPFEPNKRFLVRASVARAGVGAGSPSGTIFRS